VDLVQAEQARQPIIPDKIYFKIGEVSKIVGVKPYVLRYWESEFRKEVGTLVKSASKQRLYRRKDIETLLAIKQLLYKDGFTINGARSKVKKVLKSGGKQNGTPLANSQQKEQIVMGFGKEGQKKFLTRLQKELKELQAVLKSA
jgi:DNA-binding transcriptional MerR regulator